MVGVAMGDDDGLDVADVTSGPSQPLDEVAEVTIEARIHEGDRPACGQRVEVHPATA